jgi:hypothetical protein
MDRYGNPDLREAVNPFVQMLWRGVARAKRM